MPSATVRVIDKDKGFKRITVEIASLKDKSVKVGIMGGGAGVNGVAVVDYAVYNEFGTSNIFPRPFMGRTADENREDMMKFMAFLAGQVIEGKNTTDRILHVMGTHYQAKIQETIRNAKEWAVPNSEATIKAKGSTSPLIDTGRMLGAVRYEVQDESSSQAVAGSK